MTVVQTISCTYEGNLTMKPHTKKAMNFTVGFQVYEMIYCQLSALPFWQKFLEISPGRHF